MESTVLIDKHLGTLLSPGMFTAHISKSVERLSGTALLHSSRAWYLNWSKLTRFRAETNLRQPPEFHEIDNTWSNEQTLWTEPVFPMQFAIAHSNISQSIKVRFIPLQKNTIINVF